MHRPFLQRLTWRHHVVRDQDGRELSATPIEPVGADYTPRDERLRREQHAAHCGTSAAWPVELTRCGQPSGGFTRLPARTPRRRPEYRLTLLGQMLAGA